MCFYTIIQLPTLKYPVLVYSGNPFSRSIAILSTLVAGVYFPIEILPKYVQLLSYFFPSSTAILAARYFLASRMEQALNYAYALFLQGIIYGLAAYILTRNVIKDVQKRGFVRVPLA